MHRQLHRAGAAPSPSVAAEWCGPIDGFRAICAVLAVIGHTFLASGIFPIAGALHIIALLVPLFFAISAYVLYQSFIEADLSRRKMPSAKRFYPDARATAQLLGITDPDNNGLSGLELGLEKQIHAHAGGQLATSIDMRVQYILAHETEAARQTFRAKAAGGIVMDVNSGEVLAMISVPDFDPNARRLAGGDSTRNVMAQDVYELGSVFKIFSFALAFEDHTISSLDEVFPIGQGYKIGKYTIHEAERMPASLQARDILAQSSNIGTAQIALRSGGARDWQIGLVAEQLAEALREPAP